MSDARRARREAARAAAAPSDGLCFLSSQDGEAQVLVCAEESPSTVEGRERVGRRFIAFLDGRALNIDLIKLFLRTDCECYAATSMWTVRSHLLRFVKKEFWCSVDPAALESVDALIKKKGKGHVKKKAYAFSIEEVSRYLKLSEEDEITLRNKLVLLFGVFSLGRMTELVNMRWEDVREDDERGVYVFVLHRAKTSKQTQDQTFFLPYKVYDIDVRSIVEKYRTLTGRDGPIWRRAGTTEVLKRTTLAETTKAIARALNLSDPDKYTGHGLRATGATAMADHGATELELLQAGNWKSSAVAREYIRQSGIAQRRRADLITGNAPQPAAPQSLQQEQRDAEPAPKKQKIEIAAKSPGDLSGIFNHCKITFQGCTVTIHS